MQHVIQRDLGKLDGKLGAIRIGDRMQDHAELLEHRARFRVAHELFPELQNMAAGRNLVSVLAPAIDNSRFERSLFANRAKVLRRRQGDLIGRRQSDTAERSDHDPALTTRSAMQSLSR